MDLRRLDLNLLLLLDALFEERNVTAVAKRLQLSQPTVSFSLNKLRAFFEDELFIRTATGMQPTDRALRLQDPVHRVIQTIRTEVLRPTAFDPSTVERMFTLSMSDLGELVILPPLMERLRRLAPRVTLRSVSIPPEDLSAALANGEVDLAIGYFPDLKGAALYQQALFEHPFVCLAGRDHPTIGDRLTLAEFLEAEHIVVSQAGRSQEIFEKAMQERGLSRRIMLRSPHFMSVPLLIATSNLIAIVPRALGVSYAGLCPLKLLEPPLEIPLIQIKQFWHRRAHEDAAVAWMRELSAALFLRNDPTDDPDSTIFRRRPAEWPPQ